MGGFLGGGGGNQQGNTNASGNPVGLEFGGPPNADVSGGASPDMFNANAMNTGDSPAVDSPSTNLYAYSPAATSTQEATATAAPPATTAPGGVSSGDTGGGVGLGSILSSLFGMQAHAATPTRPGGPAEGDTSTGRGGSYGWPSGPPTGRDPYGNTYTTQPGYQASPASPLPPYSPPAAQPQQPQRAPAPTRAPAPAPTPAPAPAPSRPSRRQDLPNQEGAEIPPATPEPLNQTGAEIPPATPDPKDIEKEAFNDRSVIRGDLRYTPSPTEVAAPTARGATPAQPQSAAPVSPQSAPAPGENAPFNQPGAEIPAAAPDLMRSILGPNTYRQVQDEMARGTPLGKLLQGDLTGAVNGFMSQLRAQNPNYVSPGDVNRALKGDRLGRAAPRPGQGYSGGALPQPQSTFAPQPTFRGNRLVPPRPAPPGQTMEVGGTATAVPTTTVPGSFPSNLIPGSQPLTAPPAALPPGTATQAGPVSRETAAPAPPGAAGAQQRRAPSYGEWLRARNQQPSDQNFIRYRNETGGRGLRNQDRPGGDIRDRSGVVWTNERDERIPAPGQTQEMVSGPFSSEAGREIQRQRGADRYIPGGSNAPRGPSPAPPPDVPGYTPGGANQPRTTPFQQRFEGVPPGAAGAAPAPTPPTTPGRSLPPGMTPGRPSPGGLYNLATQPQPAETPPGAAGAQPSPASPPAPGQPWPKFQPPPRPGPLFPPGDPRAPQWYRDRKGGAVDQPQRMAGVRTPPGVGRDIQEQYMQNFKDQDPEGYARYRQQHPDLGTQEDKARDEQLRQQREEEDRKVMDRVLKGGNGNQEPKSAPPRTPDDKEFDDMMKRLVPGWKGKGGELLNRLRRQYA